MPRPNQQRFNNMIDGTYINVPDLHVLQPSKKIGLREYNNGVLVHNWYEERNPVEVKEYSNKSSYQLDFKPYPDAKPDVALRRKLITSTDGVGAKNLIGMHDIDSSKNMITMYDEIINRRPRPPPQWPAGQKFPEKRQWKITQDEWVPEKSDYPLQDKPTNWGLSEKIADKLMRENDKYVNQLADRSEYRDRYQKPADDNYHRRSMAACPKELSTSLFDINTKLNDAPRARTSDSTSRRLPQTKDVMQNVYENMLVKSKKAPRTFYYLGKIPANGSLDVYSMKDFETLTPVYEPTLAKAISNEKSTTE